MDVAISLDDEKIVENTITGSGKLATFTKALSLLELTDTSTLDFEKTGSGALYYDMSLEYTIPAKETLSRDEGFLVIQEYYDYDTYLKIRQLQSEEWKKYLDGSLTYKELTYPKDILNYLTPLDHLTVGKLVYVGNTVITGEDRDQVAFE